MARAHDNKTPLSKVLESAAEMVAVGALVAICLAMIGQVFFRYVIGAPLQWSETVSVYGLVWVIFLGAGALAFGDRHISIQSLVDSLPARGRALATIVGRLCGLAFALLVCLLAYDWIGSGRHVMAASLGISTLWIKLAIPIGAALIGIASLIALVEDLAALRRGDVSRFSPANDEKE